MISRLRVKLFKKRIQRRLRAEAASRAATNDRIRLIIGASGPLPYVGTPGTAYFGWLCTDVSTLNALKMDDWSSIFQRSTISTILAEHVIEHWTIDQFRYFLRIAREFLKPAGFIRVAVPDGLHPSKAYIESVRPGGSGPGADDHKVLYDYRTLGLVVCEEGFAGRPLEYFDEHGQFHQAAWNIDDGFIERSRDYDSRNREGQLVYTSLIFDCTPMPQGDRLSERLSNLSTAPPSPTLNGN